MKIEKLDLKFRLKSGFQSNSCENVRDIKILPWFSVVQSVEGSYDITLGKGETCHTGDGGFFLAPADVRQDIVHHLNPVSKRMTNRWIFFDIVLNDTFSCDKMFDFPTILPCHAKAEMNELFDELFSSSDIFDEYICYYRIIQLVMSLKQPKKEGISADMEQVISYIRDNYNKKISVAELADCIHTSKPNFYVLFKKQFNISPIEYVNRYRMSLASEQLRQTTRSIVDISQDSGFSSPLYFSKMFKKFYELSPSDYRQKYKEIL